MSNRLRFAVKYKLNLILSINTSLFVDLIKLIEYSQAHGKTKL